MPEESAEPPKRATTGRSISLPSSPFDHFGGDAGQRRPLPPPPGRQLSRALSSHLDRCMSAHSYHARGGRQHPASSSPARSSVIAAALGTRARRFSFVEGEVEEAAPLEVEEAAAAAAAAAAAVAPAEPSPSSRDEDQQQQQQQPRGTVLDGAAILFTAIASFPALSLPWAVSTMTWPGVAAVALCGVATAAYSCWLVSYLVGHHPKKKKLKSSPDVDGENGVFSIKEEEGSGSKAAAKAAANANAAAYNDDGNESDSSFSSSTSSLSATEDFRHGRYHDMAASILGHRTASLFVTPVQVVVCFGICVSSMLIGGTCLKALSRLLRPRGPAASSSSSSSSPLTLSQWIAVYAAFQASSAFVPSLASSAAVAIAGSVAFLLCWWVLILFFLFHFHFPSFFATSRPSSSSLKTALKQRQPLSPSPPSLFVQNKNRFLATAYSAVAGVQQQRSSSSPLPADFYNLAATQSHERAFAALNGLGVALFAWSNAFAPEVQACLKKPHAETMRRSTLAAFGLLIPCYVLIGALGFWAFGKNANVVVLLNMEPASKGGVGEGGSFEAPRAALAVAWLSVLVNLYALFAVYSFPVYECLDAFVARRVVGGIRRMEEKSKSKNGKNGVGGSGTEETENGAAAPAPPPPPPPPPRLATAVAARAAGRLLFCACCTLIAAALPFFGDIAAVLGVLSLALDFVLPCLMFLKVRGSRLGGAAAWGLMGTAGFYCLLGGAIMVAALRSLFLNAHTYKLFADM